MFVKFFEKTESFIAGDKTRLRELLNPANDPVNLPYSLAHAKLNSGESSAKHVLNADEVYFFLEGRGKIVVNGRTVDIGPGDTVLVPSGSIQHVENCGPNELSFLCIVSPAWEAGAEKIVV